MSYSYHLTPIFGVFEGKTLKQDKSNYIDPMTVNVGKYEKLIDTPYRQGDQQ